MSKYAICTCCGNIFNTYALDMDHEYGINCPITNCGGMAFGVDEEMIIPIQILNDKGYITRFSCSGHIAESICGGYIMFCGPECTPVTVPKGWYEDGENTIRYEVPRNKKTLTEKRKAIVKHIDSLIKWCEELEFNPNI